MSASSSSPVDKRDKYENEFSIFLLKRIGNAGGSLPLQQISGHLSQLSSDVRHAIGTSRSDLLSFLKRHSNLFSIYDGVVTIVDSSSLRDGGYDSDCSSVEQLSSLPLNIKNGKGVITRIFPEFGFIKAKEPVKTEVYFNAKSFGNENTNLTDFLYIGTMVYFDAKKKAREDSRSKYYALKVLKADESNMQNSTIVQKRKNRDTGLYDPMTLDSDGVIQNVFPNLGFIAVKGDENNTVFFHKNRLQKYDNIVDLTKVLSKGDLVEFTAHRSTKQDAKARWEATKVWKKSGKMKEKMLTAKSDSSHSNHSSLSKIDMKNGNKAKEMIKSQRGKICPRSQGAVIKFGENELADGDAAVYYISGSQVTDISWEFSEGDDVFFDAVKIKSAPGWKAVLVWVGKKPDIVLKTCLGDFSEFTDEETEDNLSNYVSNSSNSSMKSVSVKSGCSSSKFEELQHEKSLRLSNYSGNRETKKYNKLEYKMHDSSSQYGSQSSLSSSITSKSSQRSQKERKEKSAVRKFLSDESKSVSSWGDSPYPADENYQNILASDNNEHDLPDKLAQSKTLTDPNKKVQSISGYSSSVEEEKTDEKIEDVFSHSLEEIKNEKKQISESINNLKKAASIRKFQCIEGKIIKVYSKFAEINAIKLQNTVSFFWNDFFYNGVSVEELDIDDLKEVLKVGDTVHFNYFEIVDDFGQNWQKVSLAWKGPRQGKGHDISPEDFIKQNNLSVSIKNEIVIDHVEEKVVPRKFLTAFEDIKQADKVSRTESFSEDESLISDDQLKVLNHPSEALSHVDYTKMVSTAIIKILKKNLFPSNSKVDFVSVSEEIIKIVLENQRLKEGGDEFCRILSMNENDLNNASSNTCEDYEKMLCASKSDILNTKNSEVQTIITGDIIAQNIFTEC